YNFFISFSISIPMPIILNNIFMMPEKNYGFIQSGVPIGMIIGAIIIKKIINKLKLKNLLSLIGTLMAIEIILLAIPLIGKINSYNINYLSVYYFFIMMFIGICISLVDIPFSYSIQTDIEEGYRGRVLSLTISLVKTVVPISYLASGLLLDKVNPLIIVLFGGIAILIVSVSYYKFKIVE
ncbi:MAG: MFS transporter, partial [Clostridium sp.]|nr:MFS transporter [Clostridium sp.]